MKKDRIMLPIPYARSSGLDYYVHKQYNRFLQTLDTSIARVSEKHARIIAQANLRAGETISSSLDTGFQQVQASQKAIESALIDQNAILETGFNTLEVSLDRGFAQTALGLNEVANRVDNLGQVIIASEEKLSLGLAGLKASVDMGMMGLVSQFELQRKEMRQGFDLLADLLENAQKTEARERYRDGLHAFEMYIKHPDEPQFLTDARDYLFKSIEIFRGNPFGHLYLGHIYEEASVFFNLGKAQEHYHLCATYATGLDNRGLACVGYFMAAWMAFVLGEVDRAIRWGKAAIDMDAERIPENYYNLAKYYAYRGEAEESLKYLDKAVTAFDPLYTLKAECDTDFHPIREALTDFFVQLRNREAASLALKLREFGLDPDRKER